MKKEFRKILSSLARITKIGGSPFMVSILGGIITGFGNFGIAYSLGYISSEVIRQVSNQQFNLNQFYVFGGYFLLLIPVFYSGQMLNLTGGLKAENRLKARLVQAALRHDERTIKSGHSGDIMSRITSDSTVVDNFYFQGLNYLVLTPFVSGLSSLIAIYFIDARLFVISLLFGVLSFIVSTRYSHKIQATSKKIRLVASSATQVLSEILHNAQFIKLNNLIERITSTYEQKNQELSNTTFLMDKYNETVQAINQGISLFTQVIYLLVCGYLSLNGNFEFANVMIAISLQASISGMFGNLSASLNYFVEVSTAASRVLEILDAPMEDLREQAKTLRMDSTLGASISIENVSFNYNKETRILDQLNLSIEPFETVAFVGESGSGKTSLFRLLLGYYSPDAGVIRIDGKDLQDYSLSSIRKQMIYIQQEAPLFNRSIRDNIALGDIDRWGELSDESIVKAAKEANIHDFIMSLPEGYDTNVGESASLISGGQRQRIAIARAFISHAPILIMDEPTSALDAASESLIQASLNQLKLQKTILIAAHRDVTIRNADRIVLLKDGGIHQLLESETAK
ncbi:MAG: ABC transporter ATP-binding protein [Erysipelothrix sp.]|nr:ABC transporter ATP-binding protein [Erysipelothrix sp.]